MMITEQQIDDWRQHRENEHLEFKEAKNSFEFDKLVKYCAALANECGGSIILGVKDKMPREVVGTSAFENLERTKAWLVEKLRLRIEAEEIRHRDGRVVVFTTPSRPIGMPIDVRGAYWMRAGEDLVPMTPDQLKRIFDEAGPDYSAEICTKAAFEDLAPKAVQNFRTRWHIKAKRDSILKCTDQDLLRDAELITEAGITYAALVLMGTHGALGRFLAQAELVFEYRSSEAAGPANQREEFRSGFFLWYDRLWELINLRNDLQHYQDGLFMVDIPAFNEGAVREAVLNAVAHRDYRHGGNIFVRQFSKRIEIVSPGGFPQGITPDNILDRQNPRNRRIADVLLKCGLVERAGQGANRIYESCIREGKTLPDFKNTDEYQVSLTLNGQVLDGQFIRFLEKVGSELQMSFDTYDLLVLDSVYRDMEIPPNLRSRLSTFADKGILERIGRGRGMHYILSRRFHVALGKKAAYTRRRGLDRETRKELLYQHLKDFEESGCPINELQEVLPGQSRAEIKRLLDDLRGEGRIHLQGNRRGARWFPGNGIKSIK